MRIREQMSEKRIINNKMLHIQNLKYLQKIMEYAIMKLKKREIMQGNFDIVIFAVISAVLIYKIWRILGNRVDGEPTAEDFTRGFQKNPTNAEDAKTANNQEKNDNLAEIIDVDAQPVMAFDMNKYAEFEPQIQEIIKHDPQFNPEKFIIGAGKAFESILNGYVKGDRAIIQKLVEKDLADFLINIMDKREADRLTMEPNYLIGINLVKIDSIIIKPTGKIIIGCTIESEQIFAIRDFNDNVVQGNATEIIQKSDQWYFSRELKPQNPIWYLVEIKNNQ